MVLHFRLKALPDCKTPEFLRLAKHKDTSVCLSFFTLYLNTNVPYRISGTLLLVAQVAYIFLQPGKIRVEDSSSLCT